MKKSVRHHFVPIFLLKGFANEQGKLVIYDKQENRFLENQTPENWFHMRNLNRMKLADGVEHAWEESLLSDVDGRHGLLIHKLRERVLAEALASMSTLEKLDLLHFAMVLYWRHPDGGTELLRLFDEMGVRSDYFSFSDMVDIEAIGEEEVRLGYRKFLMDGEWQKLSKFMVPFSKGIMRDLAYHLDNFRVYPIDQVDNWFFVCGDRPVTASLSKDPLTRLFDAYALPLSSKRLLLVAESSPRFLDATLLAQINVNIVHQANRFVASPDIRFLRFIVTKYQELVDLGHSDRMTNSLFSHIAWQATFATYEDYVKAFEDRFGRFDSPVF